MSVQQKATEAALREIVGLSEELYSKRVKSFLPQREEVTPEEPQQQEDAAPEADLEDLLTAYEG